MDECVRSTSCRKSSHRLNPLFRRGHASPSSPAAGLGFRVSPCADSGRRAERRRAGRLRSAEGVGGGRLKTSQRRSCGRTPLPSTSYPTCGVRDGLWPGSRATAMGGGLPPFSLPPSLSPARPPARPLPLPLPFSGPSIRRPCSKREDSDSQRERTRILKERGLGLFSGPSTRAFSCPSTRRPCSKREDSDFGARASERSRWALGVQGEKGGTREGRQKQGGRKRRSGMPLHKFERSFCKAV